MSLPIKSKRKKKKKPTKPTKTRAQKILLDKPAQARFQARLIKAVNPKIKPWGEVEKVEFSKSTEGKTRVRVVAYIKRHVENIVIDSAIHTEVSKLGRIVSVWEPSYDYDGWAFNYIVE